MQSWCLITNWCNTRYLSKINPRKVPSRRLSFHVRLKMKVYLKLLWDLPIKYAHQCVLISTPVVHVKNLWLCVLKSKSSKSLYLPHKNLISKFCHNSMLWKHRNDIRSQWSVGFGIPQNDNELRKIPPYDMDQKQNHNIYQRLLPPRKSQCLHQLTDRKTSGASNAL